MAKRKRIIPNKAEKVSIDGFSEVQKSTLSINKFEDLADSEDDFHIGRDKIAFNENHATKRSRLFEG